MSWVVIAPEGAHVHIVHADVDTPVLLEHEHLEQWAEYESAARTLRKMGLDVPPFRPAGAPAAALAAPVHVSTEGVSTAPTPPGAEDVVLVDGETLTGRVFHTNERILSCFCNYVWALNGDPENDKRQVALYRTHIKTCNAMREQKHLRGHGEVEQYQWADVSPDP